MAHWASEFSFFRDIHEEALAEVFSCEFCEISKNTFYYRIPLQVDASEDSQNSSVGVGASVSAYGNQGNLKQKFKIKFNKIKFFFSMRSKELY